MYFRREMNSEICQKDGLWIWKQTACWKIISWLVQFRRRRRNVPFTFFFSLSLLWHEISGSKGCLVTSESSFFLKKTFPPWLQKDAAIHVPFNLASDRTYCPQRPFWEKVQQVIFIIWTHRRWFHGQVRLLSLLRIMFHHSPKKLLLR